MNPKMREFENDTFLKTELERIITAHKVQVVIETGTEYGGSANAFAAMPGVLRVVTMDITQKCQLSDLLPNVRFLIGDSRDAIGRACSILPMTTSNPTLFFLDAHSSIETDECPLRGEVKAITRFFRQHLQTSKPVLVIHDCKVPGKNFGFDTYRDGPICWEHVQDLIELLYGKDGFHKHYNEQAAGSARGCLFIEPVSEAKT